MYIHNNPDYRNQKKKNPQEIKEDKEKFDKVMEKLKAKFEPKEPTVQDLLTELGFNEKKKEGKNDSH